VSVGSASKAPKLIKFCSYGFRLVHELKTVDALQRIQFCSWMLKNEHDGLIDLQLLVIVSKAYLHLSVMLILRTHKSGVHQIPLHDIKIGMCCAVSAR
jgi:hypothetical protein